MTDLPTDAELAVIVARAGYFERPEDAITLARAVTALRAENEKLREALGAAKGYLINAHIDLETGTRKATAIATIEGGVRVIDAALAPTPDKEKP